MCNQTNAQALEAHGYEVVDLGNGWLDVTFWDHHASFGNALSFQVADDPEAVASFLATHDEPNPYPEADWPVNSDAWPSDFDLELGPTE